MLHAQPILECFGYRLEADGASFAYSGDAGPCKAMEELAQDCDVLVHMCHFISGTALNPEFDKRNMGHLELARLGQRAGVRNLVASHITEQMDVPGVRERLIREMSAIYTGNLFFGEDLMEIPVGAPGAAEAGLNFILIGDEAQRRFGWKLFTAMRYLPSGEVERVHTSNPAAYPLAGRKPRRDTPWSRQVLVRGEPYYANDAAGIRFAFEDAEKILGLGLGAVINVPVKEGERVLGTLNFLREAAVIDWRMWRLR